LWGQGFGPAADLPVGAVNVHPGMLTIVTTSNATNAYYPANLLTDILSVTQPVHGNHSSGRGNT
jgi:hypothetical protein